MGAFKRFLVSAFATMAACTLAQAAIVEITGLPSQTPGNVHTNDVFPFVDTVANVTKKLKVSDLPATPAFVSAFLGLVPDQTGNSGKCLGTNGTLTNWVTCGSGGGSGTVTSIGLTMPSWLSVSGSPVTTAGTIAVTGSSQLANVFLAAPNGSSGAMTPRLIVAADIPTLNQNTTGSAGSLTQTLGSGLPIFGNGTGIVAGTKSGSTNKVATTTGSLTSGNCVELDASGNFVDAGSPCGSGSGSGTVTDVSVVSANGLAGSVANSTTTPAITLSTTITGLLKGNGTAISSQATGDLTAAGTDGIAVTGGTGSILGSGTSIAQHVSDSTHNGYLSSTDWSTFNSKQASGNYLTAITGDVVATGPGSAAAVLATVNANTGSFGSSTSIPNFTVNGKGLVTAAGSNVVIAPAGTLTGTTLASNVVASSLTSVGTISSGTWNGTAVDITHGGTGQATATAAFDALAPTTTKGDIIVRGASSNVRLAAGSNGQLAVWDSTATNGIRAGVPVGYVNALSNADFEASTFSNGWTTTTGTAAVETSIISQGTQSFKTTASSQTSKLSQDVTPSYQTNGSNMEATCWVNTTLTNVQVCARSNGANVSCAAVSPSGYFAPYTLNLPGPTNGTSVGVEVSMTGSGTGSFYTDNCYVGPARNLGSGFLASDWKNDLTFTYTNLGSVANNNVWYRRVGDSMEVRGSVTQGASPTNSAMSINLPSGYAIDNTKFATTTNIQAVGKSVWVLNASNGVYTSGVGGEVFYDGSTTTGVFIGQTAANSGAGGLVKVTGTGGNGANDNIEFQFTVPIVGWTSSQAAYRVDITPASWSGYQNGIAGGCATTSATFADLSACTSIATTQTTTRNMTCTQASSSAPGVTCVLPRSGNYLVQAVPVIKSSSTSSNFSARLVDGSNTVIDPGHTGLYSTVNAQNPMTLMGVYTAAASGSITFKVQMANDSAATTSIVNSTATGSASIQWTIVELDAPMPAPYITGLFPRSEVIVDSCNGYGTSSKILRFSNTRKSIGTDITYADSSGSSGGSFTVNTTGIYAVTFSTGSPANGVCGVTVNNSSVNTNPQSMTYAQGLRANGAETSNGGLCSWTGNLTAGDVIQLNSDGNTLSTTATCMVDVVRIN